MTTPLLAWHNPSPQTVSDFFNNPRNISGKEILKLAAKTVVAEPALLLIATAAIVETVVAAILTGLSLILLPFTDRPFKFCASLLKSASFTIPWTLYHFFFHTPWMLYTLPEERDARAWTQLLFSNARRVPDHLANQMAALGDNRFQQRPVQQNAPAGNNGFDPNQMQAAIDASMQQAEEGVRRDSPPIINAGAQFLIDHILKGTSMDAKEDFESMDNYSLIYDFVLQKTAFLYSTSLKHELRNCKFLKPETIAQISQLSFDQAETTFFAAAFSSYKEYNKENRREGGKNPFSQFNRVISGEMQGSQFITYCWQEACVKLNPPQEIVHEV